MAIVNDKLTELGDFLLDLALIANPVRFFPFPKYFRNNLYKDEDKIDDDSLKKIDMNALKQVHSNNANKKLITTIQQLTEKKVDDRFALYHNDEYLEMKKYLDEINKHRKDLSCLYANNNCLALIEYLFQTDINLSHIGNESFGKGVDEYEFKYDIFGEQIRDNKHLERWYLFHGSAPGNWHSIMRNNLVVASNTSLMSAGAVHGVGIYASDDILVSIGYGYYVGVIELTCDPAQFRKAQGIYVIPDPKYVTLRYLLKFNEHEIVTEKYNDMLPFYKKLREKVLKPLKIDKMAKRIEADLKEVKEHYQIQGNHPNYTIDDYTINLNKYPYEPPIIAKNQVVIRYDLMKEWSPMYTLKTVISQIIKPQINVPFKETTDKCEGFRE
jgi:hypothetical protein